MPSADTAFAVDSLLARGEDWGATDQAVRKAPCRLPARRDSILGHRHEIEPDVTWLAHRRDRRDWYTPAPVALIRTAPQSRSDRRRVRAARARHDVEYRGGSGAHVPSSRAAMFTPGLDRVMLPPKAISSARQPRG
jgi:hypothetical protein